MNSPKYFDRLVASVERIARHAYYPGIDQAIAQCLEDIEELLLDGRITVDERDALRFVLLGISMTAAPSPASAA